MFHKRFLSFGGRRGDGAIVAGDDSGFGKTKRFCEHERTQPSYQPIQIFADQEVIGDLREMSGAATTHADPDELLKVYLQFHGVQLENRKN